MSCGLKNECNQEYCHRCELGENGRTMFVQSEKYASGYVDGFNNGYENGRTDAIDEFKDLGKLYSEIRAEAIEEFVVRAMTELQRFARNYGCPKINVIDIILSNVAEKLKEQKND